MTGGWRLDVDREIALIVDPQYSSWLSPRHPVPPKFLNGVIKHHQNIPIKHQTLRGVLISRLRKRLCFSNQTCPNHCLGVLMFCTQNPLFFLFDDWIPKIPALLVGNDRRFPRFTAASANRLVPKRKLIFNLLTTDYFRGKLALSITESYCSSYYTPINQHSNEKWPRRISYATWGYSRLASLVSLPEGKCQTVFFQDQLKICL